MAPGRNPGAFFVFNFFSYGLRFDQACLVISRQIFYFFYDLCLDG